MFLLLDSKPSFRIENPSFNICFSGLRSGERIEGITEANRNTMLEVFFPPGVMFAPIRGYVEAIDPITGFRDLFNEIAFFSSMSEEDRKSWLQEKAKSDSSGYLNDIAGVEIILWSVGGKAIIDQENPNLYDDIIGKRVPLLEFYRLIPGGVKVKAVMDTEIGGRHSLSLRGCIWRVQPPRRIEASPDQYIYVSKSAFASAAAADPCLHEFKCELMTPNSAKVISVVDSPSSRPFLRRNWRNLPAEAIGVAIDYFDVISAEIAWFTPSIHKSFLQKLIRTRCRNVRLMSCCQSQEIVVPADAAFVVSFILLVTDSGVFNPDLQRFVRGPEAAFKRLAVAMAEDSFAHPAVISSLLAAALVSQQFPEFVPSEDLVAMALIQGLISRNDCRAWKYEVSGLNPNQVSADVHWQYAYWLLSGLGSFATDIHLMQYIGLHPDDYVVSSEQSRMDIMPIEYCIDQHSLTAIAHFFPPVAERSFVQLFQSLWEKGTGRKFRLDAAIPGSRGCVSLQEIERAQSFMWMCRASPRLPWPSLDPSSSSSSVSIEAPLSAWSWMAGMLEKISVKLPGVGEINVFAHPEEENQFVAIRPPSRNVKSEDLSQDVKDEAIVLAKNLLMTQGKLINNALLGIHGRVHMNEDEEFTVDGVSWRSICAKTLHCAIVPDLLSNAPLDCDVSSDESFFDACRVVFARQCDIRGAIVPDGFNRIRTMLTSVPIDCMARLAMYVRPINPFIEIYRIARDGKSSHLTVSWRDSVVVRALMFVCSLAPGILSCSSNSPIRFVVQDYRSWNLVRAMIFEFVHQSNNERRWPVFHDDRKLYGHQQIAVDQIVSRMENHRRGNLIWIPVGLGKTLIVTTVLGHMIKMGTMPTYCVYSLPASAMESIMKELKSGKLDFHLVNPSAKSQDHYFRPFAINLINHDHMRDKRLEGPMIALAPDCFFIMDEFHKTLNDTQRTSKALEMAKLSNNFIAMTGTLIKDNSYKGIIEWVSQVVEFNVHEKNVWVAIASLVSCKIVLDIPQDRIFCPVVMNADEKAQYQSLLASRNGSHFNDIVKVCFAVVNRGIIEKVLELVQGNPRPVFVVAKDIECQIAISNAMLAAGLKVFCVSSKNSICLEASKKEKVYDVVITTSNHSTGFTLTQADVMVTGTYFSNQATRDQLEGRLVRLGQTNPVRFFILHTGLLSYTLKHYENTRNLSKSMSDLAKAANMEDVIAMAKAAMESEANVV